ncbi:MAG: DUF480 domain-containing protein [Kiritimatiellae bacterium]|nr:DUF480 domain-containing protein [Kiritimatiellia bacterium]
MSENEAPNFPLNAEELRVLGALIEKQVTTPDYYPLSLNALVAACNQKNNRDPIVAFDDATVARALDRLRERRLAVIIGVAGSRVPKYKHQFPQTIGLDERDTAILCELMLRGPQTAAELRTRCERFTPMTDVATVQIALDELAQRPAGALVVRLPRQPGQKESRYAHLLGAPPSMEVGTPTEPIAEQLRGDQQRVAQLESDVAALREELAALRAQLDEFRKQFE